MSGPDGSEASRVAVDEMFEILADPQRRQVLRFLLDSDEDVVPIEVLVDAVDPVEDDTRGANVNQVRTALCHWHLPRLKDAGFVEYDPREGLVRRTTGIERVEPYLAVR